MRWRPQGFIRVSLDFHPVHVKDSLGPVGVGDKLQPLRQGAHLLWAEWWGRPFSRLLHGLKAEAYHGWRVWTCRSRLLNFWECYKLAVKYSHD